MKKLLFASLSAALCATAALPGADAQQRAQVRRTMMAPLQSVRPAPPTVPPLDLSGQVILPVGTSPPDRAAGADPSQAGLAAGAARATVTLSWNGNDGQVRFETLPVDADGRFRKAGALPHAAQGSRIVLSAYAAGVGTDYAQFALGAKELANVQLRPAPGATLQGRLVRTDGSPAANVDVFVETLLLSVMQGNPFQVQQAFFGNGMVSSFGPRPVPYDCILRLFPDGISAKLFAARTDAAGRFALSGLPRKTTALLRAGNGLTLTPGSMAPLALDGSEVQSAGILVATQTGSIRVQVTDTEMHGTASGTTVLVSPVVGVVGGPVFFHGQPPFNMNTNVSVDGSGVAEIKDMLPGTYRVAVRGRVQTVRVEEGKPAPQVEFALRSGPLKGRLLDAAGKPLANVDVMMTASSSLPADARDVSVALFGEEDGKFNRLHRFGQGGVSAFGWERRPVTRTGPDGTFQLGSFPWGASRAIVRATSGCDRAEFAGSVSAIGSELVLRMQPHALVAVTGRLVDPNRRAVTNAVCQALHWLPSPRPTWFASARQIRSDAQGRFCIAGLERGESFSIISSGQRGMGQQQQMVVQTATPGVQTVGMSTKSVLNDFESPRFVASRESAAQDLGDIMVHPSSAPEDVLQSYGVGQREVVSAGVIESPDRLAVEAAQAMLRRYRESIAAGDVQALHALTSRLSPGYSPSLAEFLLRSGLTSGGPGHPEGTRGRGPVGSAALGGMEEATAALRFVPRALIRSVVDRGQSGAVAPPSAGPVGLDFERDELPINGPGPQSVADPPIDVPAPALRDGDLRTGSAWVVLTREAKSGAALAGVLHWEQGQWRVISGSATGNNPLAQLAGFFGGVAPVQTDRRSATVVPIDRFVEAREAGAQYLRAWSENRPEAMQQQTSTASFAYTLALSDFKERQERRPDQGNCPLNPGDALALQPIPSLSVWEEKWLSHVARMHGSASVGLGFQLGLTNGVVRDVAAENANNAKQPVLLQYTTPAGRFLMELIHENGAWKVVEPALPL